MSNLTIAVDDDLIMRARVRAIQQGTSLSAKVREFLHQYVAEAEGGLQRQRDDAAAQLLLAIDRAAAKTTARAPASRARSGRRTLRDELYDGDFRLRDRLAAKADKAGRGG